MNTYTLSIKPENHPDKPFNKSMIKAYAQVMRAADIPKEELLQAFFEYTGIYFQEIRNYSEKYPKNIEKIKEYAARHELLSRVYNAYGSFLWDSINSKRENLKLKIRLQEVSDMLNSALNEIEELKNNIQENIIK
jgi:hypothetical protein